MADPLVTLLLAETERLRHERDDAVQRLEWFTALIVERFVGDMWTPEAGARLLRDLNALTQERRREQEGEGE